MTRSLRAVVRPRPAQGYRLDVSYQSLSSVGQDIGFPPEVSARGGRRSRQRVPRSWPLRPAPAGLDAIGANRAASWIRVAAPPPSPGFGRRQQVTPLWALQAPAAHQIFPPGVSGGAGSLRPAPPPPTSRQGHL